MQRHCFHGFAICARQVVKGGVLALSWYRMLQNMLATVAGSRFGRSFERASGGQNSGWGLPLECWQGGRSLEGIHEQLGAGVACGCSEEQLVAEGGEAWWQRRRTFSSRSRLFSAAVSLHNVMTGKFVCASPLLLSRC